MDFSWLDKLDVNAYLVDEDLLLLYINKKAGSRYDNPGSLVGKSILDCHKHEQSKNKIIEMQNQFKKGRREPFNYTLKKRGRTQHKVIAPLFEDGCFKGMFEISYFGD